MKRLTILNPDKEDVSEEPKGSALDLMILTLTDFIANEPDENKVDLEDCKRMLEKLKAWKRLENKGFRFVLDGETPRFVYYGADGERCIKSAEESKQCRADVRLLFGGEE